ncbi:hypothetical protein L596_030594 [Steinernema carpocapsae]|uniref:Exocyst complex component Sec10-like alpha-helical bundle domain-containing protein n=1 Tax=Steinernema carpocapsae TaxID=34508 RepID=A0A4U5LPX1_STECR|nr:hypothetical protein L596_030594 [Steinernema carpocapsae]
MEDDRYFATHVQDLEQDPFDAVNFVDRLAWRITGTTDTIDAQHLSQRFQEEISGLHMLREHFQNRIDVVEAQISHEKQKSLQALRDQHARNAEVMNKARELQGTLQLMSSKAFQFCGYVEAVHAPRARAYEALQLMKHFDEFQADQPLSSDNLKSIAQGLPKDKFGEVQARIAQKSDEIERVLVEEFVKAMRNGDVGKMKQVVEVLKEFKGSLACVDAFVEQIQSRTFRSFDIFAEILTLCQKTYPIVAQIFPDPKQAMAKLILNLFQGSLKDAMDIKLQNRGAGAYVTILHECYIRTQKLMASLKRFTAGPEFLSMLFGSVFGPYLSGYKDKERTRVVKRCSSILKAHIKKQMGSQDLKPEETLLSEEVAINMLQEFKNAFLRCAEIMAKKESAKFAEELLDLLLLHVFKEHVEYGIQETVKGLKEPQSKTIAETTFFPVVRQAAVITELFLKLFEGSIVPLVGNTVACITKRNSTVAHVEALLNDLIELQLNSLASHMSYLLETHQKRSDFKPEAQNGLVSCTEACSAVVQFVSKQVEVIRNSVDLKNLELILSDLGDKLYKAIFTHIQGFIYNSTGALVLMCDLNEYRYYVDKWGIATTVTKFDSLKVLAKLLLVDPEKLMEARLSLKGVDRKVVDSFVQLRVDYRGEKVTVPFI